MPTLDTLPLGSSAVIVAVEGEDALRHRLLDMGFTPGTRLAVEKAAPMGDPIEIFIRGYVITIRLESARTVLVEVDA